MSDLRLSLLALGCAFGCTSAITEVRLTSNRALKIAQRRLRPEVRSKLLGVSSARTDSSLIPEAWRFLFHDATTSGSCRIVTVAARASSEHPDTVDAFTGTQMDVQHYSNPITQSKLVLESEEILARAQAAVQVPNIRSVEYTLSQGKGESEPVWLLRFFSDQEQPVATVQVKAKSGDASVVK